MSESAAERGSAGTGRAQLPPSGVRNGQDAPASVPARAPLLDLIRAMSLVLMALWHFVYDLALFGLTGTDLTQTLPMGLIKYAVASAFIVCSGYVSAESRHLARRGFCLLCLSLAVTLVTTALGMPIRFGILHCLALCMLITYLLRSHLAAARRPETALAACAAAFVLTAVLTRLVVPGSDWLYPLGFRSPSFYSADYYPLLPWLFLYLAAALLPRFAPVRDFCLTRPHRPLPRPAAFLARHSLAFYLLHQIVLISLLALITGRLPFA